MAIHSQHFNLCTLGEEFFDMSLDDGCSELRRPEEVCAFYHCRNETVRTSKFRRYSKKAGASWLAVTLKSSV